MSETKVLETRGHWYGWTDWADEKDENLLKYSLLIAKWRVDHGGIGTGLKDAFPQFALFDDTLDRGRKYWIEERTFWEQYPNHPDKFRPSKYFPFCAKYAKYEWKENEWSSCLGCSPACPFNRSCRTQMTGELLDFRRYRIVCACTVLDTPMHKWAKDKTEANAIKVLEFINNCAPVGIRCECGSGNEMSTADFISWCRYTLNSKPSPDYNLTARAGGPRYLDDGPVGRMG